MDRGSFLCDNLHTTGTAVIMDVWIRKTEYSARPKWGGGTKITEQHDTMIWQTMPRVYKMLRHDALCTLPMSNVDISGIGSPSATFVLYVSRCGIDWVLPNVT